MKVNIIVAIDPNFLIGKDNEIPWPIEDYRLDLKHFSKITNETNKTNYLVCGYKTYLGIKDIKLKNRRLVVIDKNAVEIEYKSLTGAIHVKNYDEALKVCNTDIELGKCDKVFVIGGRDCINKTLESSYSINKLYLTQIKKTFKGNVYLDKNLFSKLELINVNKIVKPVTMHFCEYKYTNQLHPEYQYLNILQQILDEGINCDDRTGVGIRSIFGVQMHFNLDKYFPLLTTKKMFTRGITEELLWFLRGETDAKILQEKGVHIWDGNTSREFLDKVGLDHLEEGDIGETYGFLFRHFGAEYKGYDKDYTGQGFDQVEYVLNEIRNNPNSRRIIMSLWKPPFWGKACLPPCLFLYNFRVYNNTLNCSIYQRSADMGLGVPFNIASASLMTYLFAHLTGLKPGKLVHTIADAHIYYNHIEAMKTQIKRKPLPFPKLKIKDRGQKQVEDYITNDFEILGYMSHDKIQMDMAV